MSAHAPPFRTTRATKGIGSHPRALVHIVALSASLSSERRVGCFALLLARSLIVGDRVTTYQAAGYPMYVVEPEQSSASDF